MRRRDLILGATCGLLRAAEAQPVLYSGERWDKPFLYPIRTLAGKTISRGWPLEPRAGDSEDHEWHRGFWYGHGDINGADFWREQGRDKTARLVARAAPEQSRHGAAIELAMTPPGGKAMGSMRQEFRFTDTRDARLLDATITIRADAGQALRFGDTDDGGFAFRLSEAFREDRGARLRNSEGRTGTKEIWGKPARWTDFSAEVGGGRAGVALFDHPSNLRHPTRWHARGYGLNAANPFALKSFTRDPAAEGSYTLPAGKALTLRYRAAIYDGEPDLERLWNEFAR